VQDGFEKVEKNHPLITVYLQMVSLACLMQRSREADNNQLAYPQYNFREK